MKNSKIIGIIVLFLLVTISIFKAEALEKSLSSTAFSSWDKGGVTGYVASFDLKGAIFNDANLITIKLYKDNTLLQTNTAIANKITGTGFITLFDVSGKFDYFKDGYFSNKREIEYGKNVIPNKVVATVSFSDGSILTSVNNNLGSTISNISSGQMVLGVNKFNFSQNMKVGTKGTEVKELQKFLNGKGYNCGVDDGIFGNKTKTCVSKYQLENSLEGDGLVGPKTRVVLNK